MKKVISFLAFAALVSFLGACVHGTLRHPANRPSAIDKMKSETVALVERDGDGDIGAFCAGVWISRNEVLTANHCAAVPAEDIVDDQLMGMESNEERQQMIEKIEDGQEIQYMVAADNTGMWREPKHLYKLKVVRHDTQHDLALLRVVDEKKVPNHYAAEIAVQSPKVGENVTVMGHPAGLTWTFVRGYVGAIREEKFKPAMQNLNRKLLGPWVQVVGPVWKGNSGGGFYNSRGQLSGIASFITPAPNQAFFSCTESLRTFLRLPQVQPTR